MNARSREGWESEWDWYEVGRLSAIGNAPADHAIRVAQARLAEKLGYADRAAAEVAHAMRLGYANHAARQPSRQRGSVRLAVLGLVLPFALGVQFLTPAEVHELQGAVDSGLKIDAPVEEIRCPDGHRVALPLACYLLEDSACDAGYENDCPFDASCAARACAGGSR